MNIYLEDHAVEYRKNEVQILHRSWQAKCLLSRPYQAVIWDNIGLKTEDINKRIF